MCDRPTNENIHVAHGEALLGMNWLITGGCGFIGTGGTEGSVRWATTTSGSWTICPTERVQL